MKKKMTPVRKAAAQKPAVKKKPAVKTKAQAQLERELEREAAEMTALWETEPAAVTQGFQCVMEAIGEQPQKVKVIPKQVPAAKKNPGVKKKVTTTKKRAVVVKGDVG